MVLLETAFFPPVSYFAAIAEDFTLSDDGVKSFIPSRVKIEACETYQKQSYRNRCRIYAAGGPQNLNVPVVHEGGTSSLPIREIRVDYSTPWLMRMKRAIVSAYETSAWFDYYKDDIFDILDGMPERLFDLNMALLRFFLKKIGIPADICLTDSYRRVGETVPGECDLRNVIHPKRLNDILVRNGLEKPYFQVFAGKYGFVPDLSIMDLLFNEGSESISYVKKHLIINPRK